MTPLLGLPDRKGLTVALDTETSGLFVDDGVRCATVIVAWRDGADEDGELLVRALPFDQGYRDKIPGKTLELWADPNLGEPEWLELLGWLAGQRLVFHNAKFDLHIMRAGTRHWAGIDLEPWFTWDTMAAAKLLDPLEPVGLDAVGVRWGLGGKVGKDAVREWLKKHKHKVGRYDLCPWDVMEPYALGDGDLTYRLWEHQQERVEAGELDVRLYYRALEATRWLYRMEVRGMRYDVDGSLAAAREAQRLQAELGKVIPFKTTEPAAKVYFYDGGRTHVRHDPDTGKPTLNAEALRDMVEEGVEFADEWDQWKRYGRMTTNWYQGYVDRLGEDGRLRTSFKQWHVVSGRFSVERVNLQAIPQDWKLQGGGDELPSVRSFFLPKEGHELWEMDQAQAEVRVAASLTQDPGLLAVVCSGGDIHGEITKMVFAIDESDPEWKHYRNIAKRVTFCILYGGAGQALKDTLKKEIGLVVSLAQATAWVEQYRATYPGVQAYSKILERKAWDTGFTRLASGRIRWWRAGEERHKAFNAAVQGGSAEMVLDWGLAVERAFPGMSLLTIHDSIIMEIPTTEVARVTGDVAMLGAITGERMFGVPFHVDAAPFGAKL